MDALILLLGLGGVVVLIKVIAGVVLLIDVVEDGIYHGAAPIGELEEIMRRDGVGNGQEGNVEGTMAFIGGSGMDIDDTKEE